MSLSAAVQNTLFKHKNGVVTTTSSTATVIKHRFISFLIWQSILSTLALFLTKSFLLFPFNCKSPSILLSLLAFLSFHVSLLLFSTCLFILSSPHSHRSASPLDLLFGLARLIVLPTNSNSNLSAERWRAVRLSLNFMLFVAVSALLGSISLVCACWSCGAFGQTRPRHAVVPMLGFRGFLMGLFYGACFVYNQRWVLQFPIIQCPLFFSFKMGLPSAIVRALKLSIGGYFFSSVMAFFLRDEHEGKVTLGQYIAQQIIFYIGNFVVFLCCELSHHLHQVLHTKRFTFAPPKGSAAAETNPSEYLLSALEESSPKSLLLYLAYLDLCMVCEKNVDTWRRAAFFEETSETYKRVIAVCLRPLEQLTLKLGESLESSSVQKSSQLSDQLRLPTDRLADSSLRESFNDIQLYAWCARIVASLTACSRKEDRFGVAQLSGSNAAVISTLLSALLAVETFMGKKTNLQSPNQLMGAAGIKWAQMGTRSRDSAVGFTEKRRGTPMYMKAYAMADVLRTSIYCIVSAFHDEMLDSAKAGHLEKDWITSSKVLYGARELLSQKLSLFLDFRAC